MPRIIAGTARGRRLVTPPGVGTRPTADRVREALFSTLEAVHGRLLGSRVLDLYAGSGAVGLEALSRGAAHTTFVEGAPSALRALRTNVAALGLPGAVVLARRVERLPGSPVPTPAYDVVYVDPPYAASAAGVAALLDTLAGQGWYAGGAVVVVERASRDGPFAWPIGWRPELPPRRYGEATLWYGHPRPPEGRASQCPSERSVRGPSTR